MRLVLRQSFPLGRFHATPWRVNPFDDPFGEWPPSPWRLVRAVVARWYQWRREEGAGANPSEQDFTELEALIRELCASDYDFYLPAHARQGGPLRQYHPAEFGWNPAAKKSAGMKTYGTSLAQDNYWCVPPTAEGDVWWFVEGESWTPQLAEVLDRCLERITYFGRAETLTRIHRVEDSGPAPNCKLAEGSRSSSAVPVLVPQETAERKDIERVTQEAEAARDIPQGARRLYAERLPRPPARETPIRRPIRSDCHLIQLALGWAVAPEPRAVVRLTARFRSAVLKEQRRIISGDSEKAPSWKALSKERRDKISDMTGKDADGNPLKGNRRHTEFFVWWTCGQPTRLLVWRGQEDARPFDAGEQTAILRAATRDLSWAAAGPDADAWKIKLVPLDAAVPAPPDFDEAPAASWESLTPYVPPRHHLRGGKPRHAESIENQVRREFGLRGVPGAGQVSVEEFKQPTWVAVHVPRRQAAARPFLGDRRGYWLRLRFEQPVLGPLRLGHSSSFGLGLFRPSHKP